MGDEKTLAELLKEDAEAMEVFVQAFIAFSMRRRATMNKLMQIQKQHPEIFTQ